MNKIIDRLMLISLILLPLDSFPFIMKSVYRPASLYFILIAFPFIVIQSLKIKKFKKSTFLIFVFYITMFPVSFIFGKGLYNSINNSIDFFITLTLGLITFYCYNFYFYCRRKSSLDNHSYIYKIFELLGKIYIFVLVIGIIEILIMIGILPKELKNFLSTYITGRSSGRIQLASGEPSWASMQLLFIMPIYLYLSKENKKFEKFFYLSLGIFFIIFSLQGYLMGIFAGILYLVLNRKFSTILNSLLYAIIGGLAFYGVFLFLDSITPHDVYYLNRIKNLGNIRSFSQFLFMDGSIFIRLGFPLIGVLMFFNNPWLGVGGGNYGLVFSTYITKYFPKATIFSEVVDAMRCGIGNPKNMFSRLLSETGIIGSTIFILFLSQIYGNIKKCNKQDAKYLRFWFCIIMAIYLQFDSFVYIQAWLVFAILNNIRYRDRIISI